MVFTSCCNRDDADTSGSRYNPRKMILLCGLYVSQFLGLGFIITAVPAILRDNGAELSQIGWVYLLGLIWSAKFLWAPCVDRYGSRRFGHYRSWLLICQPAICLVLVVTAFFTDLEEDLGILAILFVLVSFFSATQDIAADALAVTILKPEERGLGNSIQAAGGFLGNLIGGGVVLICYEYLGWTGSLLILAGFTAVPLVNILLYKEDAAPADEKQDGKVGCGDIVKFFRRPGACRWVPIMLTYGVGLAAAYGIINPMLVDIGWSLDRIGLVMNVVGSIVSILGAVSAGWIVKQVGRKLAMLLAAFFVIVATLGLIPLANGKGNSAVIYTVVSLMLFAYGSSTTVFFTVSMDKSNPKTAATDYTLQFSLNSILSFIFAFAVTSMAGSIGYVGVLVVSVVLTAISIVFVYTYNDWDPIALGEEGYGNAKEDEEDGEEEVDKKKEDTIENGPTETAVEEEEKMSPCDATGFDDSGKDDPSFQC